MDGPVPAYAPRLGPCWIWTAKLAYDNTDSGLTATDTQAALDEVVTRIVALETP